MAIDTNDVMLKKSRNLRGVKKVEARDVASPNFPLEGNYMTATPQGIWELGANLVRILNIQCVGNFCWEMHTCGGIKDVKAVSFDVYIVLMWDWGGFFGFCQLVPGYPGIFSGFSKAHKELFPTGFIDPNKLFWDFLTLGYLAKYYSCHFDSEWVTYW